MSDPVFEAASIMVAKKEEAIRKAIDHYFNGKPWSESHIAGFAGMDVHQDGSETFHIYAKHFVTFGPLITKIEVSENGQVFWLLYQSIEELY